VNWLFILAFAQAEEIDLSTTYQFASDNNPQAQIAKWTAAKAELQSRSAWLNMAPQLHAEANWLRFESPLESSFIDAGDLDCAVFESLGFGDLCSSFTEPIVVREDQVYEGKVQLVQPLTSLYSIIFGARSAGFYAKSLEHSAEITEREVLVRVTEAYMTLLSMRSALRLSTHTVERLEAHVDRAKSYAEQGLISDLDVRQLESALRDAQVAVVQSTLGYQVAERTLGLLIGREAPLEPKPVDTLALQEWSVEPNTPTTAQSQAQLLSARSNKQATAGQLLPTVALMAGVSQTEGQGAFAASEQRFVGMTVSGDFLWGQKVLSWRQSNYDVKIAETGYELTQTQLLIEQESSIQNAKIAYSQWENSKEKTMIAKDVLARSNREFEQQIISAADLLDAENDLINAEYATIMAHQETIVSIAAAQSILGLVIQPFNP
jgi:outer membrane protein TolC